MPKHEIIIPVVQAKLAFELLDSIKNNTVWPDRIIIIDNTEGFFNYPEFIRDLNIQVYRPYKRLDVNPSWKVGFDLLDHPDIVTVMNDDIILNNKFFENSDDYIQIQKDHSVLKQIGVFCPETVKDKKEIANKAPGHFTGMNRREGWCFTILKSLLDLIPPIPDELTTFCGDDWLWYWTHTLCYMWGKGGGNVIYHAGSTSVNQLGKMKKLKAEKNLFADIINKKVQQCG